MSILVLVMIIFAYLLGSISSAVLICRVCRLPDPRLQGSKNPGATNVLRVGGKGAAIAVLLCDILKGMIPVWLSYFFGITPLMLGFIGVAACLGHIYPIFFHFKGGKGVATAVGTMAPIGFDLTGMVMMTWLVTFLLSRYSSLAAVVTSLLAPFYTWMIKPQYTIPVAMLSCLIIFRHYSNIKRLIEGNEPKIKSKKASQSNSK
ncbi:MULTISPECIES: glycerol-3-phosphate 1-O-acyltransferase PlsY [Vibrio]|uniref:Glycerol-3-phosphate acyltransferase n=1 Tax=Vibrio casei TaxID=673372 RepID=A0A368LQ41_9VIBR|nr:MULTISPECIES: glycerol-3-phosphate 1-O-acyltransferase PlsY [Vibrio]RCS73935.1 glycerol-3-phosphate 1-O-acyltransferase PlsY [Vibrio casei]SJN31993.1 Acyl-phosphate:glycerol-3-phosphate O-acyltransferase PlsY [Vibrio casei]HBV77137.1 glycerol-3-phosphate 1-O-acyltransferase PlsY [Vibrio sp.]